MTFVFVIIRKIVLSDIFIDDSNIYMIYRIKDLLPDDVSTSDED